MVCRVKPGNDRRGSDAISLYEARSVAITGAVPIQ